MQLGASKAAVVHMVDTATRVGAARVFAHERVQDVIQALSRGWIRPCGAPSRIQFDEANCFCSNEAITALDRNNILVDVTPGEAHARLGIIGRRHQVLRTTLERFIQEESYPQW